MPSHRRRSRSGNVLSICVLAGVLVVAFGTVTVVSLYLSRVSATVESMARSEPLGGYEGRPEKAVPARAAANTPKVMAACDPSTVPSDAARKIFNLDV